VAAFGEVAAASDASADAIEDGGERTEGIFSRIGNAMPNWMPFRQNVVGLGEDMDESESKGEKFKTLMSDLGGATLAVGAAAFVGVGVAAVKMGMDFQSAMTQLVTGAGESEKNISLVSNGILNMAGSVGTSAMDLAKGMYYIESAGYHGAQGLDVLKAAAEGAKVGNADLQTVAAAVTTALTDYHIPAQRADAVTSALVETVALGKMKMDDLAGSIGKVMPVAAALGISFQDVGGAMAEMTNQGLTARFAATHLQNTLLALSAPSKIAIAAMDSVKLSGQDVKNALDEHGLAGALTLIEQHVGSTFPRDSVQYVTAMKNMLGGVTGYSTALMLSGQNSAAFESNVASIGKTLNGTSTQVQGFNKIQGDLSFQMDQLKSEVGALVTKFGLYLIPKLEDAGRALGGVVTWMEKNKGAASDLAHVIEGVLGLAVGVFAEQKAVAFGRAIGNMISSASQLATKLTGTTTPAIAESGTAAQVAGGKAEAGGAGFATGGGEAEAGGTGFAAAGGEAATAGTEMVAAGTEAETAGGEFAAAGATASAGLAGLLAAGGGLAAIAGYKILKQSGGIPAVGAEMLRNAQHNEIMNETPPAPGGSYGGWTPPNRSDTTAAQTANVYLEGQQIARIIWPLLRKQAQQSGRAWPNIGLG
jgi:TP901 family phage tail tape measure protein